MIRTVPSSGNEEIQLYLTTYYSLLRSTRAVQIKTLIEAHKRMNSALHVHANRPEPDMAAFIYAILRMPDCLDKIELVLMGQSERVYSEHGYAEVESWQNVDAPGRRRRAFFDGQTTLAFYVASRSDIDDIVPILTAYQIERQKLYLRLNRPVILQRLSEIAGGDGDPSYAELQEISTIAEIDADDLGRLSQVWGERTAEKLLTIAESEQEIAILSLAGSLTDYKRATRRWWQNVERRLPDIDFTDRPVYFVSSNTHSVANLLGGYALTIEKALTDFINASGHEELHREYHDIVQSQVPSSYENYFYYVLKKYQAAFPDDVARQSAHEQRLGIARVPSEHAFDIEVQIVRLEQLQAGYCDPRLEMEGLELLRHSRALIVNIDYPLGLAAYQVLAEIARNVADVRGVYVMGKAATLNGRIGDVMIPGVVHDEHSHNTYLFQNEIRADEVAPFLVYGTVLDNQKGITVPGTFLQNVEHMSVFYEEGYTDMEMEAGPFLSAVYEMVRPKRHPYNELVNLYGSPFPIGMVHYASDTPFSKGKNLGAQSLSYFGMDPTYATMVATLRTIFQHEVAHIAAEQKNAPPEAAVAAAASNGQKSE